MIGAIILKVNLANIIYHIIKSTMKKPLKSTGLSFSWKRLAGLTGLRLKIAHKLGISTTRGRWERKIGRAVLGWFGVHKNKRR